MATEVLPGVRTWFGSRNANGHRQYKVTHRVRADLTDGPANVMQTAGLPIPGSYWLFRDDVDIWAWCRLDMEVSLDPGYAADRGEPGQYWVVTQTFSTEPLVGSGGGGGDGGGGGSGGEGGGSQPGSGDGGRCNDTQIEDPLLEPPRLSGGFTRDREEGIGALYVDYLRDGAILRTVEADEFELAPITNSSHEQIRGPQNEWDKGHPTFRVEQNVAILQYALMTSMQNTLNANPIWGLPARSIKLNSFTWERKIHGMCYVYFTRVFDFETRVKQDADGAFSGDWDKELLDEGTMVLKGKWDPDQPSTDPVWQLERIGPTNSDIPLATNPAHFIRYTDFKGNPSKVLLNGAGLPANAKYRLPGSSATLSSGNPGRVRVGYYGESNFQLFGF